MSRRRSSVGTRGLTLLEVLVSISILALIGTLIYGALDGMQRSRKGLSRINDRYHQGRGAISRMSRELQSAFLSLHQPQVQAQAVRGTSFIGTSSTPYDRVDFNSFSHRRISRNTHESDQNEIGYFASKDPDADKTDLARREAKTLDLEPTKGGVVAVLAEDIESFDLQYLDPITGEWQDSWDSSQPAGQLGRLPSQVRITLVLRGGVGDQPLKLETKTPLGMQLPLAFGLPTP